jgi:hypothetical protein
MEKNSLTRKTETIIIAVARIRENNSEKTKLEPLLGYEESALGENLSPMLFCRCY